MNLVANYLGQFWVSLLGIFFLPIYVSYLGAESFGLVGFFGILIAWFAILDMGLTPAIARQMAAFSGGSITLYKARSLLRALEIVFIFIAAVIVFVIFISSEWISLNWLNAESLPVQTIQRSIAMIGLLVGLRFVQNIYRSSLIGLQKHIAYNIINSVMATVRGLGCIAVLKWYDATIISFFLWQTLISILLTLLLLAATYYYLRGQVKTIPFSLAALSEIKVFAGGMFLISLVTLAMTQIDKVLLTKLISLEDFGFYSMAAVVSGAIYMAVSPITQTFYPQMVAAYSRNDHERMRSLFQFSSEIVAIVVGGLAFVVAIYARTLLVVWTGDEALANRIEDIVVVLVLANFFNALLYMPYHLLLAQGITKITLIANVISLALLVPAFLYMVPLYGPIGAASVWVVFNLLTLAVLPPIIFRVTGYSILVKWYIAHCFVPSIASFAVIFGSSMLLSDSWTSIVKIIYIGCSFVLAVLIASLLGSAVRSRVFELLWEWRVSEKNTGFTVDNSSSK